MHPMHPMHPLYAMCVYGNISLAPNRCPSLMYKNCPHASNISRQCKSSRLCPMYREWLPANTTFISNPPVRPVISYSRVEVFRCSEQRKHKCTDNCREKSGAWMFVSSGSGVFYDLGRVISFETHVDAAQACNVKCENYHCMGQLVQIASCLRKRGFDNAVFLKQRDTYCGRIATELVDLWGSGSVSDCRGNSTRFVPGMMCSDGCTISYAPSVR